MFWHRLLHALLGLWPAALVWATLVLPYIAMESHNLRQAIEDMPWWMRWGLWAVEHTWPYSRMVGMSLFFNTPRGPRYGPYCWCGHYAYIRDEGPLHDPGGFHCPACKLPLEVMGSSLPEYFLQHVLRTHFPDEEAEWVRGEFVWLDQQPLHVWLDRQSATH